MHNDNSEHSCHITQYFYGAASRKGAPPIPLQGIWTADSNALPPWKGDYHFDLNVQLTYWACLNSGKFQAAECLLDFMWQLIPVHREFAQKFFNADQGIAVPGVMTLKGQPMGGWAMYSLSPVQGIWIAQHFYWQWIYTQDSEFLASRAYPYIKMIAQVIMILLERKEDGFYYLPLSSSPEIHDNTLKAWLKPNSNYDLALLKWLFITLETLALKLNLQEDLALWKKFSAGLPSLAINSKGGLRISADEDLPESHRHFSHLMGIYPLQLLDAEKPEDSNIMKASFAQIEEMGTKFWCGYSFSWMSCLYAQIGDGEHAFEYLSKFVNAFITRNYFHVNGDQSGKGYSAFTYRPFTLEGNFAAGQAVHEMLIQARKNRIRIFPAIPQNWKEIEFSNLYVPGGHCITAIMKNGLTNSISLIAGSEGEILLHAKGCTNPNIKIDGILVEINQEGLYFKIRVKKGQKVEINSNPGDNGQ